MYNNLKSKLNMYLSGQTEKVTYQRKGPDISDIMEGSICNNDNGSYYLIEERYPITYIYGGYNLGKALELNLELMTTVFRDMDVNHSIKDYLFLDTETTGLSGGTGTVAFLIGVGFFEEDAFVLRQYYMRDYDEEPAMLQGLNELMSRFKGLVTFNGKGFDWNLISTRYTFNRIKISLKNPIHMDLLYPSRRIWKLKFESCRLSNLEEKVLGEFRVDDVPGALIPGIYFNYLENRDASEIKKVILHNKLDILSMVSLLTKIYSLIENPYKESDGEHELYGIARIFETAGGKNIVINCYETCIKSDNTFVSNTAAKRLIDVCKRNGEYEKMIEYGGFILSTPGFNRVPVMIELAKYYEHKAKDYKKAFEIVEQALTESFNNTINGHLYKDSLNKRKQRIERKMRLLPQSV